MAMAARVKDAGGQRGVDAGLAKHRREVLHRARAAGGDQRDVADLADRAQLLDVIAAAHAVTAPCS